MFSNSLSTIVGGSEKACFSSSASRMRRLRCMRLARLKSPLIWSRMRSFSVAREIDAQLLREGIVEHEFVGLLHLFHRHREHGRLAGELGLSVFRGEGHAHVAAFAGLGAGELLLEAGDELARAQRELEVVGLAALEFLAVDTADEIDDHGVAALGGFAFAARRVGARAFGEAVQPIGHFIVGNIGDQLLDLQRGRIDQVEFRHEVDLDREFEVGLAADHLLQLAGQFDTRREGGLERIVADRLLARLGDRGFHDLAHHRLAEALLEEGDRRLAGAEALELHARLDLGDLAGELLVEVALRDDDLVFAAQAFGDGFG